MRKLLLLIWLALALLGQESFEERWQAIRDIATPKQLYAFLQSLPKGDLHHHATLSFCVHHVLPEAIDIQRRCYR
jgi:hypothetical protein